MKIKPYPAQLFPFKLILTDREKNDLRLRDKRDVAGDIPVNDVALFFRLLLNPLITQF